MQRARAIVVPSQAVADDLAGLFPASSQRLHVVPHGVTAMDPPTDAVARRDRMGLPAAYFLSVATLEPRKGLDVLIRALARPAAGDAVLAIAGQPGWGGVDLVATAAAAGVPPERLRLLGRLDDDDLSSAIAGRHRAGRAVQIGGFRVARPRGLRGRGAGDLLGRAGPCRTVGRGGAGDAAGGRGGTRRRARRRAHRRRPAGGTPGPRARPGRGTSAGTGPPRRCGSCT